MIKFGIKSKDLGSAAQALGAALHVNFLPHESDFRGGDYYRAETPKGTLFLQKNYDRLDEEPFESAWPASDLILYFDGLDDQAWNPFTATVEALAQLGATRLG